MADGVVKILLIEDDEDDYVLTRHLLRQTGHDRFVLDWVQRYEDGLERLGQPGYDVCLVDYRLGERNGVDLLRQAVASGCTVPIILLTGQGDHEIDMAAMQAGAADFLGKNQITAAVLERSIRYSIQQKRAEEHRISLLAEQAARVQAEAASKAKDQFLATLSHELRTPLTPVLMGLASLKRDLDFPPHLGADVDMMRRNIELEARLIDDLLDLTRITRGKLELHLERTDVHILLGHALKTCSQNDVYDKQVDVTIHAQASHYYVQADSARLEQVFWNLIKNALKFTPNGGHVEIRTLNPQNGKSAGRPATPPTLLIAVSDTGIGIESDALPRIFDAFEQGGRSITRRFGGLGLGLAISKAIVEVHGGTVRAESAGENKGSTFTVELPTLPQQSLPQMPGSAERIASDDGEHHRHQQVRILLVEDHADTARVLSHLLRTDGFIVRTAGDVATAMELARSEQFTLVISDLGLPDGNGHDLMRKLTRLQPGIRGIALSGYGMEEDIRKSLDAGFRTHLTKPLSLPKLEATIEQILQ